MKELLTFHIEGKNEHDEYETSLYEYHSCLREVNEIITQLQNSYRYIIYKKMCLRYHKKCFKDLEQVKKNIKSLGITNPVDYVLKVLRRTPGDILERSLNFELKMNNVPNVSVQMAINVLKSKAIEKEDIQLVIFIKSLENKLK